MSWALPVSTVLGGKEYFHRTEFRDILKLFAMFNQEEMPEFLRWETALFFFYAQQIPEEYKAAAMAYLAEFVTAGEKAAPGPKLFDWEQDAQVIAAGVNAVAGYEVRSVPYIHWWTFLGYFKSIGEGQFSYLVGIRDKLRKGEKLAPQEAEFYRTHRSQVQLKAPDTEEKRRLEALLGGV